MGMPSASVQPGTQPQGKGFNQSINPPQSKQLDEMQAQANASQMRTMDMPASSIYTVPQNQRPQQSQLTGKGAGNANPTTPGQPRMGQPNPYSNTVGQWDNASIQPQQRQMRGGKGKGA